MASRSAARRTPHAAQEGVLAHWQEKPPRKCLRRATAKGDPEMAHERLKPGGPATMPSRQIKGETLRKSSNATPLCHAAISADRKIDPNLPPMCGQIEESALIAPVPPLGRAGALWASI